ncbi:hypothetical protein [uncultured Alistipes sp.]|nr:hypothetical protein [uncultured Alistipes sp.]
MKTNGTKIGGTMLAMALFFAACAGDDGNPGDPAEKPGQQVVDGYVKVAINMPTSSGLTRADDRYDDGESNEYKVNEALIAFFGGTEEANATFLKAY